MEFLILFGVGQFLVGVSGVLLGIAAIVYVSDRTKKSNRTK